MSAIFLLLLPIATPRIAMADPTPEAVAGFDKYITQLEARLAQQHASALSFLAPADAARVRGGEVVIEQLTPKPAPALPGAMLHHWRGTAFVPGATAAEFERLLRDYSHYPQVYAPQVLTANVLSQDGSHYLTSLRLSQKHVITVVLDTAYDVQFFLPTAEPGANTLARGYDISRSTNIVEIASAGTKDEHGLDSAHEHGFLWRLNTYWSWREGDGGLYMQIETVSLTRSIPPGLGWAIGPFIESIPRESLEFTLKSTANALGKTKQ